MHSREEEEEQPSSSVKIGRFLRLEQILGGKSRRGVLPPGEGGTFSAESKLEEANEKSINSVQGVNIDDTMLEASTNNCISDKVHPDDLGLEIAMKQLMEATHDALVNMKGDNLKARRANLQHSSEQRAALTQEALQRISPKRLEQSVAVVRGWLQSPTPSECSSFAIQRPPPVPPSPPHHHYTCNSKAAGDQQGNIDINMFKENATAVAKAPHQQKDEFAYKTVREKRPALRILKPKNFKISDLLVSSDSDDELGQ